LVAYHSYILLITSFFFEDVPMRRLLFFGVICLTQYCTAAQSMAQSLAVTWEVENRFRFYREPAVFQYYAKIAERTHKIIGGDFNKWILATERELQRLYYRDTERKTMFPGIKRPDEPDNDWNGWASLTRNMTCRDRSEFDLIEFPDCPDYVAPVSHTVLLKADGAASGAMCNWFIEVIRTKRTDDKEYLWQRSRKRNEDLSGTPRPCNEAPRADVPWSKDGSAYAKVSVAPVGGQRIEPITIRVIDLLVIGMGDSFAAGVGNPDKPANISQQQGYGLKYPEGSGGFISARPNIGDDDNRPVATERFRQAQSEWQDIRCFRSQYGPQFRAALHLSVLSKHVAVTFLDLACSGSRIMEGLLNEKRLDRGYRTGTPWPKSQIGLTSRMLCAGKATRTVGSQLKAAATAAGCRNLKPNQICEYGNGDGEDAEVLSLYQNDDIDETSMEICGANGKQRFVREIDAILLSIGGNDIGFAPMVADVIIDDESAAEKFIRRLGKRNGDIHSGEIGLRRLALLKSKYDVLDRVLTDRNILPLRDGPKKPIFLTAYPLPLDDAKGRLCGDHKDNLRDTNDALNISDVFSNFSRSDINVKDRRNETPLARLRSVMKTACALNLRRFAWFDGGGDAASIVANLTDKATGVCRDDTGNASPTSGAKEKNFGWQYIGEIITHSRNHGFCAAHGDETLGMPRTTASSTSARWQPDLDNMRPYAQRQRWVRTPNDAYVVTNWLPGIPRLNDIANILSAATTTAMHPTAEGYAAMADAMLIRIRHYLCSERAGSFKDDSICQ
jgi:hypothetical protein